MTEKSNREVVDEMFAEINQKIQSAKAEGDTRKLEELYLKKLELIEWMRNTLIDQIEKDLRKN